MIAMGLVMCERINVFANDCSYYVTIAIIT